MGFARKNIDLCLYSYKPGIPVHEQIYLKLYSKLASGLFLIKKSHK